MSVIIKPGKLVTEVARGTCVHTYHLRYDELEPYCSPELFAEIQNEHREKEEAQRVASASRKVATSPLPDSEP